MRALLPLVALSLALGGCQPADTGGLVVYTASSPELSLASVDPDTGVWESAPWEAGDVGWIPYGPRKQVQVEHGLGHTPRIVLVYLAFDAAGSSPALAAGDLVHVEADDTTVMVRNDTNGSYFARIVVQ